jgi:predicted MFS family arabinose efflux permease
MFIPLGFLTTFLVGGWVNEFFGWRTAFLVLGLPGVALAILLLVTLREPPRGFSENRAPDNVPPPTLLATVKYFLSRKSLRHLPLGGAIHGIGAWAAGVWTLPYFMRVHDMSSGEVGTWFAFIFGIAGSAGTFLGGHVAGVIVQRTGDARWYAWFSSAVLLATVPFQFFIYLWPEPTAALLMLFPAMFIMHMFLGPVTGTIQNLGGVRRRAMAAAFYLFLANLVAMTCGPLIVGIVSDTFQAQYGDDALRYGILVPVVVTSIWAAAHFFLAARTLREDIEAANE